MVEYDEYSNKARRLHIKYTNMWESAVEEGKDFGLTGINIGKGLVDLGADLLNGAYGLAKGAVVIVGAGAAIRSLRETGDAPDCLKKCITKTEGYGKTVSAVLKDPIILAEGMAQGASDTVEEKGIAYSTSYVLGGVLLTKGISKATSGFKAGKVATKVDKGVGDAVKSYSGELMSHEGAARYSEYWKQSGIGSENTWNEFMEHNSSSNIDSYFKLVNEQSPWLEGYKPSDNVITLKEGDTFKMVLDNKQKITQPGGFGLLNDVPSIEFTRNDMAIKVDWKKNCGKVGEFKVKPGVELNVPSGPIGPQIDLKADKYLKGNTSLTQLDLFNGLGKINRNDYIEIVHGSIKKLK